MRAGLRGTGFAARVAIAAALFSVLTVCTGSAQDWQTVASTRQLHGERALTVHVQYGAGRFGLAAAPAGTLYRMVLRYDQQSEQPVRDYDAARGTLTVGVRDVHGSHVRTRHGEQPPYLDLALAPGVPLDLDVDIGAAKANLELGGLAFTRLRYKTGASESTLRFGAANPAACDELSVDVGAASLQALGLANTNCRRMRFQGGIGELSLDFSGAWRRNVDAAISVGVGSLKLRIPRTVGVAIHMSRFLASFDHAGFVKRGDMYYSGNFESATSRLTLDVSATLGGVDVQWID